VISKNLTGPVTVTGKKNTFHHVTPKTGSFPTF